MKRLAYLFVTVFLLCFSWVSNAQQKTIIIDAGHGGKDSGQVAESLNEKDITLQVAKVFQQIAEEKGYNVVLLRDNDKFVSLSERTEKINEIKPYLVISLHANATTNTNKSGIELYFSKNEKLKEQNSKFISKMSQSLITQTKYKDVKIRNANFKILSESEYPAILIELGFMTNASDLNYIRSEKGQDEIVNALITSL